MSPPWYVYTGPVIGFLAFAQGTFAQIDPAQAGIAFGIETTSKNPQALAFVRVFGSRNMSLGTAIMAMFYLGRYREMGVVVSCLEISTIFDMVVIASGADGKKGNILPHLVSLLIFGLVGGANMALMT